MQKSDVKYLWQMAWGTAMLFARWTATRADDEIIAALSSDAIFEEFWEWLTIRGWVAGGRIVAKKLKLAAAPKPTPEQDANA